MSTANFKNGEKTMRDHGRTLVEGLHREAQCFADQPPNPIDPPGLSFTELPEAKEGDAFQHEWNTYRREIGRWLAQGLEGRHVLIKGEEIIGIYDTWETAREEGLKRYLLEPFFVHPIRAVEPYLRVRGCNFPWPS